MTNTRVIDALELLDIVQNHSERSEKINAPEDVEIKKLCEKYGYGAVLDSVARQWERKDPVGCITTGLCPIQWNTIRRALKRAEAAKIEKHRADTSQNEVSEALGLIDSLGGYLITTLEHYEYTNAYNKAWKNLNALELLHRRAFAKKVLDK